jgi:hypothetical protein
MMLLSRCSGVLSCTRAGMPSIFMPLSLHIAAKYQITEMTFEWEYPVIPNMFARDTNPSRITIL